MQKTHLIVNFLILSSLLDFQLDGGVRVGPRSSHFVSALPGVGGSLQDSMDVHDMLTKLRAELRKDAEYLMLKSAEETSTLGAGLRETSASGLSSFSKLRTAAAKEVMLALYCSAGEEDLAIGGRRLRKGIATYVLTSSSLKELNQSEAWLTATPNEVWDTYPDDNRKQSDKPWSSREALVAFLAYKKLGASLDGLKWIYMGPVQTLVFPEVLLRVVEGLDPDLPYFVSDDIYWKSEGPWPLGGVTRHPHPEAPRCSPCGYNGDLTHLAHESLRDLFVAPKDGTNGRFIPPEGCPCTPDLLCRSHPFFNVTQTAEDVGKKDGDVAQRPACSFPREPMQPYRLHGPAGALISIGLLRRLPFEMLERCVSSHMGDGGDTILTECLWEAGIGITDPDPLYHPDGLTMFDPQPHTSDSFDPIPAGLGRLAGNLLRSAAGLCDGFCRLETSSTASFDVFYRDSSSSGRILVSRILSALYHTAMLGLPVEKGFDILRVDSTNLQDEADDLSDQTLWTGTPAGAELERRAWDLVLMADGAIRQRISTCQAEGEETSTLLWRLTNAAQTGAGQAIGGDLVRNLVKMESEARASAARAPVPAPSATMM